MESILLLKRQNAGFTLIELIIVLAIIIVVTGIALGGQSGFNRTLALNNASYDIGLSIQLAQSYGLSSQAFAGVGNAGYGVQFDTGSPSSYSFFADTNPPVASNALPDVHPGNGYYNDASELVQTYNLNNGFTIGTFCVRSTGNICSDTGGLSTLAISFVRPNTDTRVVAKVNGVWGTYVSACISVKSPNNDVRYLNVARTGQISMTTSCP